MPLKKKGNEENKLRRCRKWTGDELELFEIILADEENLFAVNLEKLHISRSHLSISYYFPLPNIYVSFSL